MQTILLFLFLGSLAVMVACVDAARWVLSALRPAQLGRALGWALRYGKGLKLPSLASRRTLTA